MWTVKKKEEEEKKHISMKRNDLELENSPPLLSSYFNYLLSIPSISFTSFEYTQWFRTIENFSFNKQAKKTWIKCYRNFQKLKWYQFKTCLLYFAFISKYHLLWITIVICLIFAIVNDANNWQFRLKLNFFLYWNIFASFTNMPKQ